MKYMTEVNMKVVTEIKKAVEIYAWGMDSPSCMRHEFSKLHEARILQELALSTSLPISRLE
jgi:hypothetical protein